MLIERQEAPSFTLNHFLQAFAAELYAVVIPKRYNPGLAPGLFCQYVPMPAGKFRVFVAKDEPGMLEAHSAHSSRQEMMAS